MRLVLWPLFAALLAPAAVAAPAETCTSYLSAQREKMVAAALACEGTVSEKQSIQGQAAGARAGRKPYAFDECSQPIQANGTAQLFRDCVRAHICAAQTYTCALAHSNDHSNVKECGQATTACQVTDPIPQ